MGNALKAWSTACPDWESRIVKSQPLIAFGPLFQNAANEAFEIFDHLKLVDAGGYFGDLARPWVREFVGQIFGSYDADTGIRHITEYMLLISKKNGKSSIAAGIMLTALLLNWREEAEFIILSPTVEIAANSFGPAAAMVRADPELNDLLHVQDHTRTITHRITRATLKVVAADADTVGGKKATGVFIDELWLFGKRANAESMLLEATGGLVSRPEGFIIYATTHSDAPPEGVYKKKLEYARGVRDGEIIDPQFLPVLYEWPKVMLETEAYKNPDNFYITNPNYGLSVNESYILRKHKQAQHDGEESLRGFYAKHLNVEIGLNLRGDRWPGADFWEAAQLLPVKVTLDQIIAECEVVDIGLDGGGLDDLLGASVVGRRKVPEMVHFDAYIDELTGEKIPAQDRLVKRLLHWEHAWAHPSVMKRRKDIEAKLRDLEKAGELTIVRRIGQDVDQVAQVVKKIYDAGLLDKVGLDPNAIGAMLDAILAAEVPQEDEDGKPIIVGVNQGYRLAGAIKTTERRVAETVLIGGPSLLMAWCVGNAKVKVVGNAIVITKQVSGTAKIDPLMALFNAMSLMSLNPAAKMLTLDFDNMVIGG